MSSPNAFAASRRAPSRAFCNSCGSRTIRIPLPPPPAAALIITGYPAFSAASRNTLSSEALPVIPGISGTPADAIFTRDSTLFPNSRIASAPGPMNVIFSSAHRSGSRGFSARNPYPGCIASQPVRWAASIILSISRYDSRGGGGPISTASSANHRCLLAASASE